MWRRLADSSIEDSRPASAGSAWCQAETFFTSNSYVLFGAKTASAMQLPIPLPEEGDVRRACSPTRCSMTTGRRLGARAGQGQYQMAGDLVGFSWSGFLADRQAAEVSS
jgi:hypothetical protein